MVKGRLQRSDDQRQRSIRKPPSLAHGSGLMASLMQLNRRFIEITAGDGAEAILGHIDADAVCHAARFVHDPSLRMRADRPTRLFGRSDNRTQAAPWSRAGSAAPRGIGLACVLDLAGFAPAGN